MKEIGPPGTTWISLNLIVLWLVSGVLLLGPILLLPNSGDRLNQGVVPFLLSPVLLLLFVPLLASRERFWGYRALIPSLSFPFLVLLHFFLSYWMYHSPLPGACLRGGMFLFSFTVFLMGIVWVFRGIGAGTFVSQWTSTVVGLLLAGSFVYASPFVDFFSTDASSRRLLIQISTMANPVLALGGGILEQDILRGSFLYEHISIGRFYFYSPPDWTGLALFFLIAGTGLGISGFVFYRRRTEKQELKNA